MDLDRLFEEVYSSYGKPRIREGLTKDLGQAISELEGFAFMHDVIFNNGITKEEQRYIERVIKILQEIKDRNDLHV